MGPPNTSQKYEGDQMFWQWPYLQDILFDHWDSLSPTLLTSILLPLQYLLLTTA